MVKFLEEISSKLDSLLFSFFICFLSEINVEIGILGVEVML
jgi:hypothetical protein